MKVQVKISQQTNGAYRAWCPALPGCRVLGVSRNEALHKVRLAVGGYVARLDESLPRELKSLSLAG